jgi:hypothetical protein
MAQVLALVDDLMLASRVQAGLEAAGHQVRVAGSLSEPVAADVIVCDLDAVDLAAIASAGPPTIGFYSHVEVETRRNAEHAGIDLVVPRSRMARELPALVARLLEG